MKRIFRSICCAVLAGMLLFGNMAFAVSDQIERLTPESPDYAELIALSDRILDNINALQKYDNSGTYFDATGSDIELSQAYKVYVDESDVYSSFSQQTMTYEQIQQNMDCYVWILPVHVDDTCVTVTISKGLPLGENDPARELLTQEEIQQLEADTGKWRPAAIEGAEISAEMYEQQLTDAYDGVIQHVFIMGGSPKMRSAVAVIETADGNIDVVPLEEPRLVGQLPITRSRTSVEQPKNGTVYSMEDMAAMLQPYELDQNSEQTGTGGADTANATRSMWDYSIVVGILCAATVAALGICIRKKR